MCMIIDISSGVRIVSRNSECYGLCIFDSMYVFGVLIVM